VARAPLRARAFPWGRGGLGRWRGAFRCRGRLLIEEPRRLAPLANLEERAPEFRRDAVVHVPQDVDGLLEMNPASLGSLRRASSGPCGGVAAIASRACSECATRPGPARRTSVPAPPRRPRLRPPFRRASPAARNTAGRGPGFRAPRAASRPRRGASRLPSSAPLRACTSTFRRGFRGSVACSVAPARPFSARTISSSASFPRSALGRAPDPG
jgi:hypothetical protein